MSAHRVGLLDLVRATAKDESENTAKVGRVFGSLLGATHVVDVATAVWFYWTTVGPRMDMSWSVQRSAGDVVVLAVARAVAFPTLVALAARRAPEMDGYAALASGPEYERKKRPRRGGAAATACIFAISTASQVYAGIKVNAFEGPAVPLCLSVLWTNVAAFAARELTRELTREKALYLPKVHPHGLIYDPTLCRHWCDLCSTPIDGGAYRCKLCDFDACRRCAGREDAAVVGENVLRTDSAVKTQSTSLSSAAYLARAARLARSRWPTLAAAFVLLGAYASLSLAVPSYQGIIIDRVVEGRRAAFGTACRTYLTLMIAQGALRATYTAAFAVVSRSVLFEIRTRLFASMLRQDVAFFDGTTSGHLSSRLTNDANTMMAPIDASLSSLLYNGVVLVGGVTMCFYTSYELATLAFVVVGPITTMWDAYSVWSKTLTRRVLSAWAEANAVACEALAHARTVKAFAAEAAETGRYVRASALAGYLDLGTGVLILWYGGLIVLRGDSRLTVGKLVTFQLYWNLMNAAYQSLQGLATSFTRAAAAAEKVFALLDSAPDVDRPGGRRLAEIAGHLRLDRVDFFYSMRPDKLVLDAVSLDLPPDSTSALVGASGSGKSTVISLLLRFYDPKAGRLLIDGVDVRTIDVRDYRARFGTVMQDTPLFARSVRRNVTYGLDDDAVDDAALAAAARQALAYDFVAEMPDGFDTRVGERGGRLSGGQRQRVAIARVFLRRPKIILLDEATSALDEASQAAVQDALDALIAKGGSTVVLVAHRLSTVMAADQIAVLDNGRIAEIGTHASLLKRPDGIYAALVARADASRPPA